MSEAESVGSIAMLEDAVAVLSHAAVQLQEQAKGGEA